MATFEYTEEYIERINRTTEAAAKAAKAHKRVYDAVKRASKEVIKSYTDLNDFLKENYRDIKGMSKEIRDIHIGGALDAGEAKDLNAELRSMVSQLNLIKKLQKANPEKAIPRKAIKEFNKSLGKTRDRLNLARNTAKSFVDHMSDAGPSFMKGWASFNKASKKGQTVVQSYQGMFNKAGNSLGKMPGLMKGFGKAAKAASVTLGGITKLIAGWPGAIIMAAKKMWDIGMAADQLVKDANKSFAQMRGPDIMTGDVKGQFDNFNEQIYNARENIKVGFGVEQIRELLSAMNEAGLNIQNLNKGLLTYRDAIYVAGKASKTLGLALPQVGNIMSKMMTNFRMDMDRIDEAFVQVAFDAQKSGLATDKFWSTVENASASLALYGTFVSAASKTMKAFTEDMVGGADDAAEATEDMYSVFKTGNTKAQAALLDLAKQAGVSVNEMFREQAEEFKKRVVEIQSEISVIEARETKTPEDIQHLKKLRAELSSTQSKQQRALNAIGQDSVVQTAEMGMLVGQAPKLLQAVIKKVGSVSDLTQFSGKNMEKLLVEFKAMGVLGVKEKTVRMLIDHARNTRNSLNNLYASSSKYFSADAIAFKNNKDAISKAVRDASKPGVKQVENGQKLSTLLQTQLNMDKGQADMWAEIAKTDQNISNKIAEKIEKGDPKSLKSLNALLSSSDFLNKYQITRFKSQEKTEKELTKSSEKTFDEIVKGTLSYNEMVKMGKDELYWTMANWKVATLMNKTVADIYHKIPGGPEYLSHSQKTAQEQIKLIGLQNKEIKELIEVNKKGNITAESQAAMVSTVAGNIKDLDQSISTGKDVEVTLSEAMAAEDPEKYIRDTLKEARKEGNKGLEKALDNIVRDLRYGNKDVDKYLQDTAASNEKTLKVAEKEKVEQEKIKTELMSLNNTNEKLFEIQKAKLMGDKESLKGIADEIFRDAGADVKKIEEKAASMGLTLEEVSKAYEAGGYDTAKIDKKIKDDEKKERKKREKALKRFKKITGNESATYEDYLKHMDEKAMAYQDLQTPTKPLDKKAMAYKELQTPTKSLDKKAMAYKELQVSTKPLDEKAKTYKDLKASAKSMGEKIEVPQDLLASTKPLDEKTKVYQGLQEPVRVTSPGNVILDPGEIILPRAYSEFKATPVTNEPRRVGPDGGGAPSKSIQINVTATEKDLAKRIANEVRAVINQEYIGVV